MYQNVLFPQILTVICQVKNRFDWNNTKPNKILLN